MSVTARIHRDDIEREANALVGVPFRHQNSDPRTGGVDCRGVLEWIAHRLTGRPLPHHTYRHTPSGEEFYEKLSAEMDEIALDDALRGDVVMMRLPRDVEARHVAVLVRGEYEMMIVHAFERTRPGAVVKEPYRGWPRRCAVRAFRYRGIAG